MIRLVFIVFAVLVLTSRAVRAASTGSIVCGAGVVLSAGVVALYLHVAT